jgi:hypothetical protein
MAEGDKKEQNKVKTKEIQIEKDEKNKVKKGGRRQIIENEKEKQMGR